MEPRFTYQTTHDGEFGFSVASRQNIIVDHFPEVREWLTQHYGPTFSFRYDTQDDPNPIYRVTRFFVVFSAGHEAEAMAFRLRWC